MKIDVRGFVGVRPSVDALLDPRNINIVVGITRTISVAPPRDYLFARMSKTILHH